MLKVQGISKSYNRERVLENVSLEVSPEIKALIGLNGSGKSTLLKIIAGIVPLDQGKVWLGDEEVTRQPPEKRNVGYVPQNPALFQHLTVDENIRYGLRNGRGTENVVQEMVELMDLKEVLHKKPSELSGGYKSRTCLARALVPRPRVMLLDEPLNGMDAALKEKMLPEFRKVLKASGIPVLFVTHDVREAELVADSFAVIHDGQVHAVGGAEEAFHKMCTGSLGGE
jgi:ABC-type Fe3+/spermidine/putrescine transport system ATPase subunit